MIKNMKIRVTSKSIIQLKCVALFQINVWSFLFPTSLVIVAWDYDTMASLNPSLKQDSMEITSNTPLPEFVNFDQKLKCTACKKLLLSPMQLPCGHRICKECKELLVSSKESELQCPSREEECGKFSPADVIIKLSELN